MYYLRLHNEDTGSRFFYKNCGITIQKTVTFIDIPWQCSKVGSLTPECEETNPSAFLLLTGSCDHTTI